MKKKSVVVTGGNSGIGFKITEAFINAGYYVIVGARRDLNLNKKFGNRVSFIPTDVRDEDAHIDLVNAAISKAGQLDIYINNAGFSEWRPIGDIDNNFLDNIISTNLKGAFWGCKAASSVMKDGASIIAGDGVITLLKNVCSSECADIHLEGCEPFNANVA